MELLNGTFVIKIYNENGKFLGYHNTNSVGVYKISTTPKEYKTKEVAEEEIESLDKFGRSGYSYKIMEW